MTKKKKIKLKLNVVNFGRMNILFCLNNNYKKKNFFKYTVRLLSMSFEKTYRIINILSFVEIKLPNFYSIPLPRRNRSFLSHTHTGQCLIFFTLITVRLIKKKKKMNVV